MVKSFKQNIIQRILHPSDVFLRSGKETFKLRLPLSKTLTIQLPCVRPQETYKWLPSKESLKNFSKVDLIKKDSNNCMLKFKPKKTSKGVIEIFYVNINEPEKILNRYKLYYLITARGTARQTLPTPEFRQ